MVDVDPYVIVKIGMVLFFALGGFLGFFIYYCADVFSKSQNLKREYLLSLTPQELKKYVDVHLK